jgi:hypothetical protein
MDMSNILVGRRLRRYVVVDRASTQGGRLAWNRSE